MGQQWKQWETLFWRGSKITADSDCSHKIKRCLFLDRKSYDQPRQHIKKQRHYFANKGLSSQGYDFSSSHVWIWELDYKESWVPKNWCFWTVVLEKTLWESLGLQGDPTSPFWRRSALEFLLREWCKAETPVLWPPHEKRWLIGKDWCWEGLRAGGEGDDRGWDGWMTSLTRWMWVWVNSGSWWWTGRPGVLRFMGSPRVGHDWATDLNWTEPSRSEKATRVEIYVA